MIDIYVEHSTTTDDGDKENLIKINLIHEKDKRVLDFSTTTYYKLGESDIEKNINPILQQLSDTNKIKLFNYYIHAYTELDRVTDKNFINFIGDLMNLTKETFDELGLADLVFDFASSDQFVYPNLKVVGSRAHDKDSMTFKKHEYEILTSISIFCKFMVPIWGQLLRLIKSKTQTLTGTDNKEFYCYEILSLFLESTDFNPVINKLKYFSSSTIDSTFKYDSQVNNAEYVISSRGISKDKFKDIVFSNILVKTLGFYNPFVNNNNTNDPPNIMSIINSSIKKNITSKITSWRNSNLILPRHELENSTINEEDNSSQLDHHSNNSTKAFDVPILMNIGAVEGINVWLNNNNIPMNLFNKAVDFYLINKPNFNEYNESLCASVITTQLQLPSSAYKYVEYKTYIEMLVISQIVILRLSNNPIVIAQLLTTKLKIIDDVSIVRNNKYADLTKSLSKNSSFQSCKQLFPEQVYNNDEIGVKRTKLIINKFEDQIKNMLEWILRYKQCINVAPTVFDIVGIKDYRANGEFIEFDMSNVIELCEVFIALHSENR